MKKDIYPLQGVYNLMESDSYILKSYNLYFQAAFKTPCLGWLRGTKMGVLHSSQEAVLEGWIVEGEDK